MTLFDLKFTIFQIKTLLENEENYKRTIESLNQKIEELNDRLTGRSEVENELRNQYIAEIDSRTKLADVYKGLIILLY